MALFYPSGATLVDSDFVETAVSATYSAAMSCSARNAAIVFLLLFLPAPHLFAQGASTRLSFADGQIDCEISSPQGTIPELLLSTLPVAMNAALEHVGPPPGPARLVLRIQKPPPFYKRARALFRVEAFAIQKNDEILLHVGDDPLKLAFRIAHELSHWLVYKKHPARPPLWLDEGLASFVGAETADTTARIHKQSLERPPPSKLEKNLFDLDELASLQAYPKSAARSAAFYWQAEALVRAIHQRLGSTEFGHYLGLLCASNPPPWQTPLRERWYFSDWDMNWLSEQIRPSTAIPSGGEK